MSTTAQQSATTPIPVQLSEPEFEAFILPHLSMPKRGPKCKLGYYRVFNLILWVLYTGMQWKCLPVPQDAQGHSAIHYTTVYKVFAKWADDGSLWQAFVASVRLSLSRLNHWPPWGQAHPEVVQGTAQFHHQITDAFFPQADAVFHDTAAFDTAVDMLDPQP